MEEALLIEIAQRRRKLEDCLENVDLALGAADPEACCPPGYETLQSLRNHLESSAEACRDDMNAMADALRKAWL